MEGLKHHVHFEKITEKQKCEIRDNVSDTKQFIESVRECLKNSSDYEMTEENEADFDRVEELTRLIDSLLDSDTPDPKVLSQAQEELYAIEDGVADLAKQIGLEVEDVPNEPEGQTDGDLNLDESVAATPSLEPVSSPTSSPDVVSQPANKSDLKPVSARDPDIDEPNSVNPDTTATPNVNPGTNADPSDSSPEPTKSLESSADETEPSPPTLRILGLEIPQPSEQGSMIAFDLRDELRQYVARLDNADASENWSEWRRFKKLNTQQKQGLREMRALLERTNLKNGIPAATMTRLQVIVTDNNLEDSLLTQEGKMPTNFLSENLTQYKEALLSEARSLLNRYKNNAGADKERDPTSDNANTNTSPVTADSIDQSASSSTSKPDIQPSENTTSGATTAAPAPTVSEITTAINSSPENELNTPEKINNILTINKEIPLTDILLATESSELWRELQNQEYMNLPQEIRKALLPYLQEVLRVNDEDGRFFRRKLLNTDTDLPVDSGNRIIFPKDTKLNLEIFNSVMKAAADDLKNS